MDYPKKAGAIKLPSPQERLDLILVGLSRGQPIEALCRQAGISRELFYRWMRRVREAGLKALGTKDPGPKTIPSENLEAKYLKLQEKVRHLEKKNRRLQSERDHLDLVAKVSRRIIQRQAWGPIPEPEFKKNDMRRHRSEKSTDGNGKKSSFTKLPLTSLLEAGASIEPRIGDGREKNAESQK